MRCVFLWWLSRLYMPSLFAGSSFLVPHKLALPAAPHPVLLWCAVLLYHMMQRPPARFNLRVPSPPPQQYAIQAAHQELDSLAAAAVSLDPQAFGERVTQRDRVFACSHGLPHVQNKRLLHKQITSTHECQVL